MMVRKITLIIFLSLQIFQHGISARIDDDENDRYRNDNYVANIGYQISDQLRAETILIIQILFLNMMLLD